LDPLQTPSLFVDNLTSIDVLGQHLYNRFLLMGKKPIIKDDENSWSRSKNDHLVHQKIEELKKYIFDSDNNWTTIYVKKLTAKEEQEVEKIYQEIKRMIETLI
jgi:hypothetical protein